MSLAHPGWLMLLLILPFILLGAILAHRGRSKAWQRMVAPRLRKQLINQGSSTRRWVSLGLGLTGAALIIVTIARPHIGETTTTERIRTRNILIAIDTSRSMLVRDGSPDRIAAAQAMALELLETFPDDRVGVMAFSGTPVLMAPLTIDHTAVHETISQLNTNVIPTGGSDVNEAVMLALNTFKKSGQNGNALIIISDGENHSEQTDITADAIRSSGTTVCTISVGTKQGGIIPDYRQPDRKFRDIRGQTVLSQMNPEVLDTLARAGNGVYLKASTEASSSIHTALTSLKRHEKEGRKLTIPNEKYQWFLFPAILLLILSLLVRSQLLARRIAPHTTVAILIILSGMTYNLQASPLEQAEHAYERKDYTDALKLFKQSLKTAETKDQPPIHFAIGSSAYRLKKWNLATSHFSIALISDDTKLQEKSHYNLANSLFRSGMQTLHPENSGESVFLKIANTLINKFFGQDQADSKETKRLSEQDLKKIITLWEDSIAHHQAALDLNPENQHATDNKKNVERLLEFLKKSQQQEEDQGDEQKSKDDEQGHKPETDPNPENQESEGTNNKDNNNDSGDQNSNDQQDQGNKPDNNENPDDQNSDTPQDQSKQNQPRMEQKEGESDEAYSARILKENSDAETRPVQRRNIRLRRPAKDW